MKGKKRKKMSEARRKALAHARGIVKTASKSGKYYFEPGFYASLKDMSTQKLKNISRKSLIQGGIAKHNPEWRSKSSKAKPMSVSHGIIERVRNAIKEGLNYFGQYRKDGTRGARDLINQNARELSTIFEGAISRLSEEEVAKRLKRSYPNIRELEDFLERWMFAVYDDIYREDEGRWEADRAKFMNCLDTVADDIPGGLLPYDRDDF